MQAALPVDLKAFEVLEGKIQKMIEMVTRLKHENEALRAQVESLQDAAAQGSVRSKELDGMRLTSQQLERELMALKDERQQVLAKVDVLLGSLEKLTLE